MHTESLSEGCSGKLFWFHQEKEDITWELTNVADAVLFVWGLCEGQLMQFCVIVLYDPGSKLETLVMEIWKGLQMCNSGFSVILGFD